MARAAILRDGLLLRRAFVHVQVAVVMAAETPWVIHVAKIVGVGSPRHVQVRKYVAIVNSRQGPARELNIVRALGPHIAIFLLIESVESGGDFLTRLLLARVGGF